MGSSSTAASCSQTVLSFIRCLHRFEGCKHYELDIDTRHSREQCLPRSQTIHKPLSHSCENVKSESGC